MVRTIISLIPYTLAIAGHERIYHNCLSRAALLAGWEFIVYAEEPHFSPKNSSRLALLFSRFRDFSKIFKQKKYPYQLFFIESMSNVELFAYVAAGFLFTRRGDRQWLLLRREFAGKKAIISLLFLKVLSLRLKKRLSLFSDSALVANYFSARVKPTLVMPIPHTEDIVPSQERQNYDTLLCWSPGPPREEKGIREITRLISSPTFLGIPITLMISEKFPFPHSPTLSIEKLKSELDRGEYIELLAKSDVILLPYDPEAYRMRTSGIFVEAIVAGKMPLVKEGSWLAHELRIHNLEELIVDWENPHFFAHLLALLQNPEVSNKRSLMQKNYREKHSVEAMGRTILAAS